MVSSSHSLDQSLTIESKQENRDIMGMQIIPYPPISDENIMASDVHKHTDTEETYQARLKASRDPVTGRFKKGSGYPGRKKGSFNKRRALSAYQRMDEMRRSGTLAIDPIEELARIGLDSRYEARTRLSAWKALARYIYPQRKAVDVSMDEQEADMATLSDEELVSILEGIRSIDTQEKTI